MADVDAPDLVTCLLDPTHCLPYPGTNMCGGYNPRMHSLLFHTLMPVLPQV